MIVNIQDLVNNKFVLCAVLQTLTLFCQMTHVASLFVAEKIPANNLRIGTFLEIIVQMSCGQNFFTRLISEDEKGLFSIICVLCEKCGLLFCR